jgi:hypothetical protein
MDRHGHANQHNAGPKRQDHIMIKIWVCIALAWFVGQIVASIIAWYCNPDRIHKDNPAIDHVYLTACVVLFVTGVLCLPWA